MNHIFLSYVPEDADQAVLLQRMLEDAGLKYGAMRCPCYRGNSGIWRFSGQLSRHVPSYRASRSTLKTVRSLARMLNLPSP